MSESLGVVDEIRAKRDAILGRATLSPYAIARITGKPVRWPQSPVAVLPAPAPTPKPIHVPRPLQEPVGYYQTKQGLAERELVSDGAPFIPVGVIMRAVCEVSGISFEVMRGVWRAYKAAHPRHVAMYLTKEMRPDLSIPQIGGLFNRDHTTVLSAITAVQRRFEKPGPSLKWYRDAKNILEKVSHADR